MIGLHLAFSDEDERPVSTYGEFGDPDLGCIYCTGNSYSHSSKPTAIVSCLGAIGELDWIDDNNNGQWDINEPFIDLEHPLLINANKKENSLLHAFNFIYSLNEKYKFRFSLSKRLKKLSFSTLFSNAFSKKFF